MTKRPASSVSRNRRNGGSGIDEGITPPAAGSDVICVYTGGTVNGSGQRLLATATATPLHGAEIGESSVLTASNTVYIALEDYADGSINGVRVWIDHPTPASLTTWSSGVVQGLPDFVRYDGIAPWTITAGGSAPDLCSGWVVTADPTGANDPLFDTDGSHRIDVQILRDDAAACDVPFAVFDIATSRSAPTVPNPPTSVSSTAAVNGGTITWTAGSGAVGYDVAITPSGGVEVVFFSAASPYAATGLTAGVSHAVRVRSIGADDSRSTWASGASFTPTSSGGSYPATRATGDTTQALRKRTTVQGENVWDSTYHVPVTVQMSNNSRTSALASTFFTSGIAQAVTRWDLGRGTVTSSFDGPTQCLTIHGLSYGQNAKYVNNNNLLTFERMAEAANGSIVAAIESGITSLYNRQDGGVGRGYWLANTTIRLGWELGGQWNPVFPGVDTKLMTQLGTVPSGYSDAVKAAWTIAKNTGDRFPMFKIAWDLFCNTMDAKCEALCDAAGIPRAYPLICANLAYGSADPSPGGDGPGTQFVPQCVTDVDRTPDIIGLDLYGRGAPRPVLTGAANGNPANYDWTDTDAELNEIRDLCLETSRPLAMMEFGSCRRRDQSFQGGGWLDHERAAFHAYLNDWLDTGCGGAGVPIYLVNWFMQDDCTSNELNARVSNNWSYTWRNDTATCITAGANGLDDAPLLRAEMLNWYTPTEVPS